MTQSENAKQKRSGGIEGFRRLNSADGTKCGGGEASVRGLLIIFVGKLLQTMMSRE